VPPILDDTVLASVTGIGIDATSVFRSRGSITAVEVLVLIVQSDVFIIAAVKDIVTGHRVIFFFGESTYCFRIQRLYTDGILAVAHHADALADGLFNRRGVRAE